MTHCSSVVGAATSMPARAFGCPLPVAWAWRRALTADSGEMPVAPAPCRMPGCLGYSTGGWRTEDEFGGGSRRTGEDAVTAVDNGLGPWGVSCSAPSGRTSPFFAGAASCRDERFVGGGALLRIGQCFTRPYRARRRPRRLWVCVVCRCRVQLADPSWPRAGSEVGNAGREADTSCVSGLAAMQGLGSAWTAAEEAVGGRARGRWASCRGSALGRAPVPHRGKMPLPQ